MSIINHIQSLNNEINQCFKTLTTEINEYDYYNESYRENYEALTKMPIVVGLKKEIEQLRFENQQLKMLLSEKNKIIRTSIQTNKPVLLEGEVEEVVAPIPADAPVQVKIEKLVPAVIEINEEPGVLCDKSTNTDILVAPKEEVLLLVL